MTGGRSLTAITVHTVSLRWLTAVVAGCAAGVAMAAEAVPTMVRTAPGRFEISAVDPNAAHALAHVAEEGWRLLALPLGLPEAFSSPVFVRVVAPEPATPAGFSVAVEPGGIVSVRLVAGREADVARRAMVQGLLTRLAVARHGVGRALAVPLWLEHGAVVWWVTHADAAQGDALRQESLDAAPPALMTILGWQRGQPEPRDLVRGAGWLFAFLHTEARNSREWPALVAQLLVGEDAAVALARAFNDRFGGAAERELWWQTGYHSIRRSRTLPSLDGPDSRLQLAALARFVFAGADADADRVVNLRSALAQSAEPFVGAELARRIPEVERLLTILHPYYRNAGLSLAEALRSMRRPARERHEVVATFERDWQDALELELAATAALNALEARPR